jgi:hypothetical protein
VGDDNNNDNDDDDDDDDHHHHQTQTLNSLTDFLPHPSQPQSRP